MMAVIPPHKKSMERKNINLENLYKLRDAFFDIHYKSKLYAGGLYPEQKLISNAMIKEFVHGHQGFDKEDIYISISRQFGKSFIVFNTMVFLLIYMPEIARKSITIGITTNKKDQIKKNFTEVRRILEQIVPLYNISFLENSKTSLEMSNGSKIVLFSMEAGHNEGDTLDMSIVDEAQDLKDTKYEKEIVPMMSRTRGISVFLGVGGYRPNQFMFELNNTDRKNRFIYDCYKLVETCKIAYKERGDDRHLFYSKSLEEAKRDMQEIQFQTQYELKWAVELGTFIELDYLRTLRGEYSSIKDYEVPVDVGIDWAKTGDRTVVTIVAKIEGKIKVLDWYKIPKIGVKYTEQLKLIYEFLKEYNVRNIYTDTTGVGNAVVDFFEGMFNPDVVVRIDFSEKRKDIMGTGMDNILQGGDFEYPNLDNRRTVEFEEEFNALEKHYKRGGKMTYCHPEKGNFHDDYVDSLALALLFTESTESGVMQVF